MTDDVVAETRATYDRIAEEYDARNGPPSAEFADWRERALARLAGQLIADLGCGPGNHTVDLMRVARVVGLDLSAEMLAIARRTGAPVVRGDLRRLPFADASLDAIWCVAALLHVPRADVASTLAEWRRVVRPGGLLALSTSVGDDEGWELVPYDPATGPTSAPLHRWFVHHQPEALVKALENAGWSVESVDRRTSHRDWVMVLARRGVTPT